MKALRSLTALALVLSASSAFAVDSAAIEYGTGNRSDIVRLSAQWNWKKPLWSSASTELTGHWDVNLTRWNESRYNNVPGQSESFWSTGITPVFRLQGANSKTGLYGEAGLGAHYFSSLYNNNSNQLSTHYQFGTLLGAGYRFTRNFDLGLRVQHFSNGGFKEPNSGVNLAIMRAAYRF
jgi:lipid A 3-O-deacylase